MNMSYCRFHNTLSDLTDCLDALNNRDIHSLDEALKAQDLILLCKDIAEWYEPEYALDIYNEYVDAEEE